MRLSRCGSRLGQLAGRRASENPARDAADPLDRSHSKTALSGYRCAPRWHSNKQRGPRYLSSVSPALLEAVVSSIGQPAAANCSPDSMTGGHVAKRALQHERQRSPARCSRENRLRTAHVSPVRSALGELQKTGQILAATRAFFCRVSGDEATLLPVRVLGTN